MYTSRRGVPDHREDFAGQVADGLRDGALHLPDVVVHAREQLARAAAGEERRRLAEHVLEQLGAERHDHPMPEIVHQ